MSASLKARVARLEQRQTRRSLPRIVFKLHGQVDSEIVAYQAGNVTVVRSEGETAQACAKRAFELQPSAVFIAATYANRPWSAVDCEEARQRSSVTPDASTASDGQETDPYALAGIGREATREELIRMGAVRVTPEWPV